jgi:HlyD family secretion protein/adhesin transport system membrane fusion protein
MMQTRLPINDEWNYRLFIGPIAIFLLVFTYWAYITEVDEVVKGEGKVIPSSQTQVIQHFEGGIIKKILVQEGQSVAKGQPLYELDNAFFQSDYREKHQELLSLEAKERRLGATAKNQEKVLFTKEMENEIPHIVSHESYLFSAHKNNYEQEINMATNKMNQRKYKLNELQHKLKNLKKELTLTQESLKIINKLYKKGAISQKERLADLKKEQELITQIGSVQDSIPVVREEMNEEISNIISIKSRIESKIYKELTDVRVKINQLKEQSIASKDRTTRTSVLSPVDGIIKKMFFHTIGGVVKAGDDIVEITPSNDSLLIEAQIKTNDRARVWRGQKVSIEITAYTYTKHGFLEGELTYISPDSFVDQKSGQIFYSLRVKSNQASFGDDKPIMPGMVANVNILTGRKTILEYLLKPIQDVSQGALVEP